MSTYVAKWIEKIKATYNLERGVPRFVLIKVDELSEQTGHGASKLLGCAAKVERCHLYEHIFFSMSCYS